MTRYGLFLAMVALVVLKAQSSHWSCDPHEYQYDMTAYVQLSYGGQSISDLADFEVAIFVANECRGVAQWVATTGGHRYGLVRIWSNVQQGEAMTWRANDVTADATVPLYGNNLTLTFESQSVAGMPSAPIVLDLLERVKGDVTGDGIVDIADVNAVINMMLGKVEQTPAGDVTGDGGVDIADVNAVINVMLGKSH